MCTFIFVYELPITSKKITERYCFARKNSLSINLVIVARAILSPPFSTGFLFFLFMTGGFAAAQLHLRLIVLTPSGLYLRGRGGSAASPHEERLTPLMKTDRVGYEEQLTL